MSCFVNTSYQLLTYTCFEPRRILFRFPGRVQSFTFPTALGPTELRIQWGSFPGGGGVELPGLEAHHFHLVPSLRMGGVIHPTPHHSMTWCLSTGFYVFPTTGPVFRQNIRNGKELNMILTTMESRKVFKPNSTFKSKSEIFPAFN
jgi:hypothetical protein